MLGVIHRDRESEHLLSGWLESFRPDIITLEFSHYGLNFREARGAGLRQSVRETVDRLRADGYEVDDKALSDVFSYIDLPAEYTIASEYSRRHVARVFLVDMDCLSSSKLAMIDDLLARENLISLLCGVGQDGPDRRSGNPERVLAGLFFEKGVKAFTYTREMRVRGEYMRDRIVRLMERYQDSRFLHICGWQHLYDPYNIYGFLNPTKVFIHDKAFRV